jgi:hypothetical protein
MQTDKYLHEKPIDMATGSKYELEQKGSGKRGPSSWPLRLGAERGLALEVLSAQEALEHHPAGSEKTKALLLLQRPFHPRPWTYALLRGGNCRNLKSKSTQRMNICRHIIQSEGPSRKIASEFRALQLVVTWPQGKRRPGQLVHIRTKGVSLNLQLGKVTSRQG